MAGGLIFETDRDDISVHIDQSIKAGMRRPISRALNRSMSRSETQAKRILANERNVRISYVGKQLVLRKATTSNLEASIHARGTTIPLTELATMPVQLKAGVRARITKYKGARLFKGAFIAKMPNGKIGVFERKGKTARRRPKREGKKGNVYRTDLPITEIRLPAIASTLMMNRVLRQLQPFTIREFETELLRQLDLQARGG